MEVLYFSITDSHHAVRIYALPIPDEAVSICIDDNSSLGNGHKPGYGISLTVHKQHETITLQDEEWEGQSMLGDILSEVHIPASNRKLSDFFRQQKEKPLDVSAEHAFDIIRQVLDDDMWREFPDSPSHEIYFR